jgi:antitoxin HicB
MTKKMNLDEYLSMSWHFSIQPSEWEGEQGFWAWVSELPNCSTFGNTQSEALSTVAKLLPAYLKAAVESNASIPTPVGREPEADEVGGTIVLRLPKSLHLGLKHAARTENTSLNQYALFALTKMVYQTTVPDTMRLTPKKKPAARKVTAKKSTASRNKSTPGKRKTAKG